MKGKMKMAMDDKKPPLKIQANSPYLLTLEEHEPFKSGVNTYGRAWHGYKIRPINGSDVYFASDAVKGLFNVAGVKSNVEFALEMKTGNTKDGNPFTVWLLNGKSLKDYTQENGVVSTPSQPPTPTDTPIEDVGEKTALDTAKHINDWVTTANSRLEAVKRCLDAIEKQMGILVGLVNKNDKVQHINNANDEDIPF